MKKIKKNLVLFIFFDLKLGPFLPSLRLVLEALDSRVCRVCQNFWAPKNSLEYESFEYELDSIKH